MTSRNFVILDLIIPLSSVRLEFSFDSKRLPGGIQKFKNPPTKKSSAGSGFAGSCLEHQTHPQNTKWVLCGFRWVLGGFCRFKPTSPESNPPAVTQKTINSPIPRSP